MNKLPKIMLKTLKHSIRFYRKLKNDIGGLCKLALQKTNKRRHHRISKFFYRRFVARRKSGKKRFIRYVYRLDIITIRERKRRFKKRFTSLRLVKLFYLTLGYNQFKKAARAARKKDGFFEGHYCLALEGRLIAFLYRTGFVASLFESLSYVRKALITINHKALNFCNQQVNLYKILSFQPIIKKKAYFELIVRLYINKKALFPAPSYMYVSHGFLFAFMHRHPLKKDLVLPKFLDIYRATGYAH